MCLKCFGPELKMNDWKWKGIMAWLSNTITSQHTTVLTWEWETFCLYVFPSFACALLVTPASPHSPKSCIWSKLTFACEWLSTFKSSLWPPPMMEDKIKNIVWNALYYTLPEKLIFETIEQHLMWSFILTFIFVQFYW